MKEVRMRNFVAALALILITTGTISAQGIQFQLGFKALAEQIPDIVGTPLEAEHWGANHDSLQRTTKGLMVWRAADNWTAFTNGSRTWVNGPYGVMERANEERFAWEAPAPPPGVGMRIVQKGAALTVNSIGKVDKVSYHTPKPGNLFLVTDVTVENVNIQSFSYSPIRFSIKAADGYSYEGEYTSVDRELEGGDLAAGQMARGRLAFEVPANAKGLTLLWRVDVFGYNTISAVLE